MSKCPERHYQNSWFVFFKYVRAVKDNNNLRSYFRLKEAKDIWQLNATYDPGLDMDQIFIKSSIGVIKCE